MVLIGYAVIPPADVLNEHRSTIFLYLCTVRHIPESNAILGFMRYHRNLVDSSARWKHLQIVINNDDFILRAVFRSRSL